MVDSDNGKETVHCFTLYFSFSNIWYFKNTCVIWHWDPIHQEDGLTHTITSTFYKML